MSRAPHVLTAALCAAAALGTAAPALAAPGDQATARRIACEQYAVQAATFDYRNLAPWRASLTRGTSPELRQSLNNAANSMNQQLQSLKWVSTARLAGAEVADDGNGVWTAKCFVKVHATNVQAPQGRDVLTTYVITLDQKRGWLITDVAGLDAAKR